MRFKITNIENVESSKKYTCKFYSDDVDVDFFTFMSEPEILQDSSVLTILASFCEFEFGGEGMIFPNDQRFDSQSIILEHEYEV